MKKISVGRIFLHVFLILMSLTYILPIILMLSISFSSEGAIKEFGYTVFPRVISLDAYKMCFRNPYQLIQSYKITCAFSMLGTALATLVQSLMAYSLSRKNFKLRGIITKYIFVTMLFSGGLVPTYILNTKYLHLGNSFWIYIFPGLMSAWNVIVFRTFFQGLPDGLVEAAKIDGAKEIMIYFRIILPLSTPVLASLGFMMLVSKWNDWNTSLIYVRDSELYSLQYLLQRILREAEYVKNLQTSGESMLISDKDLPTETMRYAMAILAAGPMLVVFPFFQKYFAKGMVVGAVKG